MHKYNISRASSLHLTLIVRFETAAVNDAVLYDIDFSILYLGGNCE
jgi:hypothetical protein